MDRTETIRKANLDVITGRSNAAFYELYGEINADEREKLNISVRALILDSQTDPVLDPFELRSAGLFAFGERKLLYNIAHFDGEMRDPYNFETCPEHLKSILRVRVI